MQRNVPVVSEKFSEYGVGGVSIAYLTQTITDDRYQGTRMRHTGYTNIMYWWLQVWQTNNITKLQSEWRHLSIWETP